MRGNVLRKVQPYGWILVGFAIANLVWVVLQRHAAVPAPRRPAPPLYTGLGTGAPGVRILHFYAGSGEVIEGEHTVVCYGVENARAVRLEPAVAPLRPVLNRCFSVSPMATTTYTLYAEGDEDEEVSAAFTVRVLPAPARIVVVDLSHAAVVRGEPVTACFKLQNAISARLEPLGLNVPPERPCLRWYPSATLKYTIVATGAGGADRQSFEIAVRARK